MSDRRAPLPSCYTQNVYPGRQPPANKKCFATRERATEARLRVIARTDDEAQSVAREAAQGWRAGGVALRLLLLDDAGFEAVEELLNSLGV